jgi:large subunit ribosomal protein L17
MFRNMVTSLFKNDRIKTTDTKAKEIRRWADQMITLAKRGDLHARRQAMAIITEKKVVHKLFETANDRWGSRSGGYTRVLKIGRRPGDAAPMSIIELVAIDDTLPKKKSKQKPHAPVTPEKQPEVKAEAAEATPAVEDTTLQSKSEETETDDETLAEAAQEDAAPAGDTEAAASPAEQETTDTASVDEPADQTESEEEGKSKE